MKINRDLICVFTSRTKALNYLPLGPYGLTCVFVESKSVWCNQEPLLLSEGGFKNVALEAKTSRLNS